MLFIQDVHADLRGTTVLMRSSVPALLLESKEYHILACQQRPSTKGKRMVYRCVVMWACFFGVCSFSLFIYVLPRLAKEVVMVRAGLEDAPGGGKRSLRPRRHVTSLAPPMSDEAEAKQSGLRHMEPLAVRNDAATGIGINTTTGCKAQLWKQYNHRKMSRAMCSPLGRWSALPSAAAAL